MCFDSQTCGIPEGESLGNEGGNSPGKHISASRNGEYDSTGAIQMAAFMQRDYGRRTFENHYRI